MNQCLQQTDDDPPAKYKGFSSTIQNNGFVGKEMMEWLTLDFELHISISTSHMSPSLGIMTDIIVVQSGEKTAEDAILVLCQYILRSNIRLYVLVSQTSRFLLFGRVASWEPLGENESEWVPFVSPLSVLRLAHLHPTCKLCCQLKTK
jgi:hypothetical protein